jgi:hypothetical protein
MRLLRSTTFIALATLAAACGNAKAARLDADPSPIPLSSASASPTAASPGGPQRLPDYRFDTIAQARVLAASLHLLVATSSTVTMNYQPGTVLSQQPPPGTLVKAGAQIRLTVAQPPACDPSYPTVCIPPFRTDIHCADIPYVNFPVRPPDTDHFDLNHDGIGCFRARLPGAPSPTPSG